MKLTYVTGNYGKYFAMKRRFENMGLDLEWVNLDTKEPEIDDVALVSKEKARQAFDIIKKPCFVMDSGFYIEDYPGKPGYPGAMVKRSGIGNAPAALLETMRDTKNRNCKFVDCLTFYDGEEFYQFFNESKGRLADTIRGELRETAQSGLWLIFILDGFDITIGEMSEEERLSMDDKRVSAAEKFIGWYRKER